MLAPNDFTIEAPRVSTRRVKVRVLRSAFYIAGRVPAIGDIVEVDEHDAQHLVFTNKAERIQVSGDGIETSHRRI